MLRWRPRADRQPVPAVRRAEVRPHHPAGDRGADPGAARHEHVDPVMPARSGPRAGHVALIVRRAGAAERGQPDRSSATEVSAWRRTGAGSGRFGTRFVRTATGHPRDDEHHPAGQQDQPEARQPERQREHESCLRAHLEVCGHARRTVGVHEHRRPMAGAHRPGDLLAACSPGGPGPEPLPGRWCDREVTTSVAIGHRPVLSDVGHHVVRGSRQVRLDSAGARDAQEHGPVTDGRHSEPNADIQRVPKRIRALDVGAEIKVL
jgi:hypothetical protein